MAGAGALLFHGFRYHPPHGADSRVWASGAEPRSRGSWPGWACLSLILPGLQVLIRSGRVPIVSLECVSCKAQAVYAVSRSSYVYLEGRCDNCGGGSEHGVSRGPRVGTKVGGPGGDLPLSTCDLGALLALGCAQL